jgi:putative heme iron utilization protein
MSAKLMDYFNKTPRIGTLSTASKNGQVNTACFGSPRMIDEKTVVMSVRNGRTFANLQENPNAVFMIIEPAKNPFEWKGVRVYLKMTGYETSGEKMEAMRKEAAQKVGEEVAKAIHAVITFEIQEIRPLSYVGRDGRTPSKARA